MDSQELGNWSFCTGLKVIEDEKKDRSIGAATRQIEWMDSLALVPA